MPYISRAEAAAFLAELGFPVAKNTLQKYASVGGGPPCGKRSGGFYRRFKSWERGEYR